MYISDKITNGGGITTPQTYKMEATPFYIFLSPKDDTLPSIKNLMVKLNYSKDFQEFPFVVGTWNPIVVDSIIVDDALLQSYNVYWGTENG